MLRRAFQHRLQRSCQRRVPPARPASPAQTGHAVRRHMRRPRRGAQRGSSCMRQGGFIGVAGCGRSGCAGVSRHQPSTPPAASVRRPHEDGDGASHQLCPDGRVLPSIAVAYTATPFIGPISPVRLKRARRLRLGGREHAAWRSRCAAAPSPSSTCANDAAAGSLRSPELVPHAPARLLATARWSAAAGQRQARSASGAMLCWCTEENRVFLGHVAVCGIVVPPHWPSGPARDQRHRSSRPAAAVASPARGAKPSPAR